MITLPSLVAVHPREHYLISLDLQNMDNNVRSTSLWVAVKSEELMARKPFGSLQMPRSGDDGVMTERVLSLASRKVAFGLCL